MANKSLVFKDVKLIFTNWAGARDRFGNEGKRHFSFILDEEQAEALHQAGVNVKRLKPRDKEDEPAPYVKVNVKVRRASSQGHHDLGEASGRSSTRSPSACSTGPRSIESISRSGHGAVRSRLHLALPR